MRIVMLDPAGFTAHYDANLCHALAGRGHEVTLDTSAFLFENVPPLPGYIIRERFFTWLSRGSILATWQPLRRAVKAAAYPFELARWGRNVRHPMPDVVHVQWSLLPFWDERVFAGVQRRGARLVLTVHDVEPLPDTGGSRIGAGRLYGRADAIITHSQFSRDRLVEDFALPAARIHVVPLGGPGAYAEQTTTQMAAREQLGLHAEATYLLFFGLIKEHKGLDLLFEALARARAERPSLRLLVAGEPMQSWSSYAEQLERLRLRDVVDVRLGFVPTAQLPLYFAAADLVAVPYRKSFQSGVVVAAYEFGRPVLASAAGGLPELVTEGETGFLAPPGDLEGLTRVLLDATADPDRLLAMRTAAEARAKAHSWEGIAARHEEIYESGARR